MVEPRSEMQDQQLNEVVFKEEYGMTPLSRLGRWVRFGQLVIRSMTCVLKVAIEEQAVRVKGERVRVPAFALNIVKGATHGGSVTNTGMPPGSVPRVMSTTAVGETRTATLPQTAQPLVSRSDNALVVPYVVMSAYETFENARDYERTVLRHLRVCTSVKLALAQYSTNVIFPGT
jgi:hypothetical protein